MKYLFAAILAFLHFQIVCGQINANRQFLQTNGKSNRYYVYVTDSAANVYAMGGFYDVAGTGYSIAKTDTLQRLRDGTFSSDNFRIIHEQDGLYLVNISGKNPKHQLHMVTDSNLVNSNLNNAWYLQHFVAMSRELNEAYPLNSHSFRDAFSTWELFPGKVKEMHYLQFRAFADKRIKEISDSISAAQEKYIRLTNYIVQHVGSIDYTTLKDSLSQIPADYAGKSRYYQIVIDTVALKQPEYFFRLAEDLPKQTHLIILYGVDYKQSHPALESVEGHDAMKREFFAERKFNRQFPFKAIGTGILGVVFFALVAIKVF